MLLATRLVGDLLRTEKKRLKGVEPSTLRRPGSAAREERAAAVQVPAILSVLRRNPDWIFQAQTVRELVEESVTLLRGCGLRRVAARLESGAPRAPGA